jgi:hypothetical protein
MGLLAACSGGGTPPQETAIYKARAKQEYTPPGPPEDPWGPYIAEAAQRFDVPERWIREVMRIESGGQEFLNGQPITSGAGAMGLMQVMPGTYDGLRARYGLGDDPYHPHDNILAGTAYLREMYEVYGAPGFLAAYNAGPGRLEDYLIRNRPLPDETRRYVSRIAPNIADVRPQHESGAAQLAMYQLPSNIPAGPRYPRGGQGRAPVALADNRGTRSFSSSGTVIAMALPPPPAPPPVQVASAPQQPRGGFHLIAPAMADTLPARGAAAPGTWAIQVGAYSNETQARTAAGNARVQAHDLLAAARPLVGTVQSGRATLYRARLTGLSRDTAVQACERISRGRAACIVLSPSAQS